MTAQMVPRPGPASWPLRLPVTPSTSGALLHCPVRGPLNVAALAKDGLTATEEARRIDFLRFLLDRGYPETHIAVETVILSHLGESGRSSLRCDVIVYDAPLDELAILPLAGRIRKALLVAEIKREANRSESAWEHQLEPAMRLLPGIRVMGAYWDSINRLLFVKQVVKQELRIFQDTLSNLPVWGEDYKRKPLVFDNLTPSSNLVGMLFNIANVMRSHGVNDEHVRYKETVKLLLARYCDEREAAGSPNKALALQVYPDPDTGFMDRVEQCYQAAKTRYSRAKTIFGQGPFTDLSKRTLREIIRQIQGTNFLAASNETMQQVFMSFVPVVFKKSLDQYFTPLELVKSMVSMTRIGPNDKVADPGMGTADFLTAASEERMRDGDADILQRIYGFDSDPKAFDLAVVNMILNKDGQSNLYQEDSLEHHARFAGEMGVVLCNPPFGARSVENRQSVLEHYDLGHVWEKDESTGSWQKTDRILTRQQLGILFIERCFKLLSNNGRLAIVLPEGYLCTSTYGYVRQWLIERVRILALIELPRRIFVKSNADLRSNVLVARKMTPAKVAEAVASDYPIYTDMVRKVGFKMGKGNAPRYLRDRETGIEIRDESNARVADTDFRRVADGFDRFTRESRWENVGVRQSPPAGWSAAKISDVIGHSNLDLKPRRLMAAALQNLREVKAGPHVALSDIAELLQETVDLTRDSEPARFLRAVAGMSVRAVEGIVTPSAPKRAWQIAEAKGKMVYRLRDGDIIMGLVRPERRNIGLLLAEGDDIVGIQDGIAVLRVKPDLQERYPQGWLFAALRSEACRLQLWTESGGTSYGKLADEHINGILLPVPSDAEVRATADRVAAWSASIRKSSSKWQMLGQDADRRPIINSSGFGLIAADEDEEDDEEEEG